MKKNKFENVGMLGWIVVPCLGLWLAVSYFLGITQRPQWSNETLLTQNQVLGASTGANSAVIEQQYNWNGQGLVTFWFDDAWSSQYMVARPILKEHNYLGALAVPTQLVGFEAYMTWAQVKRVMHDGWEITAHSRDHLCDEASFTSEGVTHEVVGSKKDLDDQGIYAEHYVAPCGVITDAIAASVKDNYVSLRTTEPGVNPLPVTDPYHIFAYTMKPDTTIENITDYLTEAKERKGWVILMFHQIDENKAEYSVTPTMMTQIVQKVKESGLEVVLPSQVLNMETGNE